MARLQGVDSTFIPITWQSLEKDTTLPRGLLGAEPQPTAHLAMKERP